LNKSDFVMSEFTLSLYERTFEQLFGDHKDKALACHQLICLEEEKLADLIRSYSLPLTKDKKSTSCKYTREKLFDEFMFNHLNLDSGSFN
jgi:hypothetical protein